MMTATAYPQGREVMTFAATVTQAHKFLTALLRGEEYSPSASVLQWLSDRDLIEEMLGDDDLEYEITQKGREAVLGKRRGMVLN